MENSHFEFADIDFETRSELDITAVGAWRYSEHHSTEVLICVYSINGRIYKWVYGDEPPETLIKWLKNKKYRNIRKIRAFNSMFEFCIWNNVCTRLGWPRMPLERFYCSMADACSKGFPGSLEKAGEAMGLHILKDTIGKKLINKFSKPLPEKNGGGFNDPLELPNSFYRFIQYCTTDVKTQIAVSEFTGTLSASEWEIFLLTEKMNERGIPVDKKMIDGAIYLAKLAIEKNEKEAKKITGGGFSLSQTAQVKKWLNENGVPIPDMQKRTIERTLKKKDLPDKARKILELRLSSAKTSTAKYQKAKELVSSDGRIHGAIKYHIAKTGRWAGRGLQIQNFVRPNLPKWTDYLFLSELIRSKESQLIEIIYGDLMEALSSALRTMIRAPEGKKFVRADYAQIEARINFWLAGENKALKIFAEGGDIYCDMASDIYGFNVTKENEMERFMGKQSILGLGFQMAAPKFKKSVFDVADIIIELLFSEKIVKTFRNKFKKVKAMWGEVNQAAMNAVMHRGKRFYCCNKKIYYIADKKYLYSVLPSGRKIHYFDPVIEKVAPPPNWEKRDLINQITFMGSDPVSKKWVRLKGYGGYFCENNAQAIARDIMANGALNVEKAGYDVIFLVHDEPVSVVDEDFGSYKEYEKLLCKLPKWAEGLPVEAEGCESIVYKK